MKASEWLLEYRKSGNILIGEGKWSAEVMKDKETTNLMVKDRVKAGEASVVNDDDTGQSVILIEKGAKYLTNPTLFEQIERLLELYSEAMALGWDAPPWMECRAVKVDKNNAAAILHSVVPLFYKVGEEYNTAWSKVIPKEMALFHARIEESVCHILAYVEEKSREIMEYDRKKDIQASTPKAQKADF